MLDPLWDSNTVHWTNTHYTNTLHTEKTPQCPIITKGVTMPLTGKCQKQTGMVFQFYFVNGYSVVELSPSM